MSSLQGPACEETLVHPAAFPTFFAVSLKCAAVDPYQPYLIQIATVLIYIIGVRKYHAKMMNCGFYVSGDNLQWV